MMTVLNKDKILEAAKEWIDQGRFDRAIREYEKLLTVDPKDMRVRLRIAELFARRKQSPEAIRIYREVAEGYTRQGFFLKAVTVYKNILRLNPSLMEVNRSLAELYEKMGLSEDAVHQFEILANSFEQKSQFEESLKIREKLAELAPNDVGGRIRLAEGYQREGKKEEALDQYEIIAAQYRKGGKEEDKLIDLYQRILPHRAGRTDMLEDLIGLFYKRREYKEALKWLEKNAKQIEENVPLIAKQAEMYGFLNQLDTARSKYQKLAELYLGQGNKEEALKSYCEILILIPEEAESLRPIVEGIETGRMERLLQEAKRLRLKRQEDQAKREEESDRKKREAQEKARISKMPPAAPKKEEQQPSTAPVKSKPPRPPKEELGEKERWIQEMKAARELAQVYEKSGLTVEANQEWIHVDHCVKKILKLDPNCAEALAVAEQLEESTGGEISQETSFVNMDELQKKFDLGKKKETKEVKPSEKKKPKKISFV